MRLEPVDVAVASILALAVVRGLWLGAVREAFSLAAVAAAVLAARAFGGPATALLADALDGLLPTWALRIAATGAVAVAALLGVAAAGRLVRRSVRFAGLGLADRLAGGGLGALEGAVLVALGLAAAGALLEPDHPLLADSRAHALFQQAATQVAPSVRPDVAASPPARPR